MKSFNIKNPWGVLVNKIYDNGPAARAGIKPGDIIIGINKFDIADLNELNFRIATLKVDNKAIILLFRNGKKEKVIPRDVSFHVVSERPSHIDFMRIVKGSKIILEIPVIFKNNNDSPGLKKGGVLNIVRRKVQLKCQAENIPENLVIDLTGLDIGASIKISAVKL
mgnify:CR=1 FL=1